MESSKWIWTADEDPHGYNLAAQFRKTFVLDRVQPAVLRITADSQYRLIINESWINDGPGKAYPEHFQYDEYDITENLVPGENHILVVARYFGIGTFHQIVQQAGFLAEIEVVGRIIPTDSSWMAAPFEPLRKWVPKVSCQMEPCEWYDSRREDEPEWKPACELYNSGQGPWQDLGGRNTKSLTKISRSPESMLAACVVRRRPAAVCVPVTQIAHPGVIETNNHTSRPVMLASVLTVRQAQAVELTDGTWFAAVNGKLAEEPVQLSPGRHTVVFFCAEFYGHRKELPFQFLHISGGEWSPWQVFVRDESLFRDTDIIWMSQGHPEAERMQAEWLDSIRHLSTIWTDPENPPVGLGRSIQIADEQLFMEDYTATFAARQPVPDEEPVVENPTGCCGAGIGHTVLHQKEPFDIELCYDFGEQVCGYFELSLEAPAGAVLDLHLVEYIRPDGIVQHTAEFNRNGMRYVAAGGLKHYLSLKRRSGRYLFLTARNLTGPVTLHKVKLVQSTADVAPVQRFRCSDNGLEKVWDACERTLRMGMEDTFTDCSLYEQTLWIGDARNQALYAFNVYGAYDVSARSLQLGAQSLERFPMVGCQVPSTWECLLPAWSFLWGMHVWEHFFHSGDAAFLESIFPAVMKNLEGASRFLDDHGLFSGTFWNLLEWADIDQNHPTVLHNSLLLVSALKAAENCAGVLGKSAELDWLKAFRKNLVKAVNQFWDPVKNCYPDAILADGRPSAKTCQHTTALAVIAGILPAGCLDAALGNLLDPPPGMTRINSPFAAQFLFEALELLGHPAAIVDSIRHNYLPMIAAGATTVWETFPDSTCSPQGFPTRSHCHGWSCGPLQFFNRIILGIRQVAPGGESFEVSPLVCGLTSASGAMATPHGPLRVDWTLQNHNLKLILDAPTGVTASFRGNSSHRGLAIHVELLSEA